MKVEEEDIISVIHQAADNYAWSERTLCCTLQDMRKVLKCIREATKDDEHLNKMIWVLMTLVEEFQVYGNRMEAALSDQKEWKNKKKEYNELCEEIKELEQKVKTIKETKSDKTD